MSNFHIIKFLEFQMTSTSFVFIIFTILVSVLNGSEISKDRFKFFEPSNQLPYNEKKESQKILAQILLVLTVSLEMGIVLCAIASNNSFLKIHDALTVSAFGLYGLNKYCMFKAEAFRNRFTQAVRDQRE